MAKYLVIVESPAKVKTIKKFLGSQYEVVASMGHVRDLPKSQMGFDPENDFEPKYITIRGKGDLLASLRKQVKKADKIFLATDPDREGEAISWHLVQALNLEGKKFYRISFNEITKNAVTGAIKSPREIDTSLVDAQQTRRILDRMVGYRISPLLWAKVKRGLSAGRVQSAVLRMICEREDTINSFVPEEYWTIDADIKVKGKRKPISAKFYGTGDKKTELTCEEDVKSVLRSVKRSSMTIGDIRHTEKIRKSANPFTTSTMQQEASKVLNFSTQKTMRVAQQLYEGVDVEGQGTIGIITYLRTDSVRLSDDAEKMVRSYILENYGENYVTPLAGPSADNEKQSKHVQDAHEAIRPTDVNLTPAKLKSSLTSEQYRLYNLIWKRFVACRMADAVYDLMHVTFCAGKYTFNAVASKSIFDGFMSVYSENNTEDEELLSSNFTLSETDKIEDVAYESKQHFTQPPAHYTEASLVRAMEELGIGRPSTYAPTISTILARHYIVKENRALYMTEIGEAVNQVMMQSFEEIINPTFTANMEMLLDNVAEGEIPWKLVIRNFYPDLDSAVVKAEQELEHVQIRQIESDVVCEFCGKNLVFKYGPHGKFLACPGFPECRNTKPYFEKIGVACPKCGKEILIRKTRNGRRYYGCENNPECDFVSWSRPAAPAEVSADSSDKKE